MIRFEEKPSWLTAEEKVETTRGTGARTAAIGRRRITTSNRRSRHRASFAINARQKRVQVPAPSDDWCFPSAAPLIGSIRGAFSKFNQNGTQQMEVNVIDAHLVGGPLDGVDVMCMNDTRALRIPFDENLIEQFGNLKDLINADDLIDPEANAADPKYRTCAIYARDEEISCYDFGTDVFVAMPRHRFRFNRTESSLAVD